jgi:hypothetical protein
MVSLSTEYYYYYQGIEIEKEPSSMGEEQEREI